MLYRRHNRPSRLMNAIIGAGTGGCHFVFFGSWCHLNGKCSICPAPLAFEKMSNAHWRISFWRSKSSTSPNGRPKGYSMAATRGMPIIFWKTQTILSVTVGIPAFSIARATNPTDRQQSGQTGASIAKSTLSCFIWFAISGPETLAKWLESSPWKPIIE